MQTYPTHLSRPFVTASTESLVTRLLATEPNLTPAFLRITLASVLLPHGAQHLLGAFGGHGFSATVAWLTGTLGIPAPLAVAGILLEFVGPIVLLAGLASRLVGLSLAVFMTEAMTTPIGNGFFMNWFGTLPAGTEGFEYHLLAIVIALSVVVNGGGAFSLDRVLTGARERRTSLPR